MDVQFPLPFLTQVDDRADPGVIEGLPTVWCQQVHIFTAEENPTWRESPVGTLEPPEIAAIR